MIDTLKIGFTGAVAAQAAAPISQNLGASDTVNNIVTLVIGVITIVKLLKDMFPKKRKGIQKDERSSNVTK